MDAPPLCRSVRARNALNPPRIYTLADLDLDCLALILSLVQDEKRKKKRRVRDSYSRLDPNAVLLYQNVVDCKARFRAPPLACKALAAAAARPSVAWENLSFSAGGRYGSGSPAGFTSFLSALQRVATSVQHLYLQFIPAQAAQSTPALLPALEAVAPYLQSLEFGSMPVYVFQMLSVVPGPMRSATRLVELNLGYVIVTGPPGMLAATFPALAARVSDRSLRWDLYAGENSLAIRLNRDIVAASAAAGRPVRLIKFGPAHVGPPTGDMEWYYATTGIAPVVELDVEALGVEGLTSLSLTLWVHDPDGDEGSQRVAQAEADAATARMATLVARLPALRDLTVHASISSRIRLWPVVFDLRAVHALSRLVFVSDTGSTAPTEVRLSFTLAANLQVLALNDPHGFPERPPGCVRNASDALTRLTRLEYGLGVTYGAALSPDLPTNLSAWGNAAKYTLPALRYLTVRGYVSFTVDGQGAATVDGRAGPSALDWAAGVLRTLPRLERLTLVRGKYRGGTSAATRPLQPLFVYRRCRRRRHCRRRDEEDKPCEHRRSTVCAACAGARAVEKAVMEDLPAAGAAAGRRLAVRVVDMGVEDIRLDSGILLDQCTLGYGRAPQ